ncbi:MAG: mechanosensitive ion channel domain-containing protein [Pseudomonadota bacterium]
MKNFDFNTLTERVSNPDTYVPWILNICIALSVLILGRYLVKFILMLVRRGLERAGFDEILRNFICSLAKSFLYLVLLVIALDQLGVNTTSLVALIGAAGLAIGLALQDSLKNFASGVLLVVFRPFSVGDYIEAAGTAGTVRRVNIFSSVLTSPDNKEIIVPNGAIFADTIVNYSAHDERRADWVFGIGYEDDIAVAKGVIERLLEADTRVKQAPEPVIVIGELGDNSVNITVRAWVATEDYWDVKFEITEKVKLTFDAEGVSIPYPQMSVHMVEAA